MAWYTYPSMVAVDATGFVLHSGSGQIYAEDDLTFSTPLPITNLAGAPLALVNITEAGLTTAFRVEAPECVWRSGAFVVPLSSPKGMREAAEAAAAAAVEAAETAAEHTHAGSDITSGVIDPARLGSGASITTKFLRGDGTWQPVDGGSGGGGGVSTVNGIEPDETGDVTLDATDVGAAAAVHDHDSRYYTESEVDTLLGAKASAADAVTSSTVDAIWTGTAAAYAALGTKNSTTLYLTTGS